MTLSAPPRTWGSTRGRTDPNPAPGGSPTHVGIDLVDMLGGRRGGLGGLGGLLPSVRGVPRGRVPGIARVCMRAGSPRVGGRKSPKSPKSPIMANGSPTHVGIDPHGGLVLAVGVGLPHARGDRPTTGSIGRACWGGSPTHVGIDPPPYSHAEAFVRKAIEHQRFASGPTYALLRLSFLEPTKSRRDLLTTYHPDVLILPRRPVFDGRGTDSITSAWFCWLGEGRIIWLPEAP